MTAPYFHSVARVTPVPSLEDPPPPDTVHYIVARSRGYVAAARMAARLHGTPAPSIISIRSSSKNDVLAILSDHQPRTTDCIHQELHATYRQLPFPWRWIWKIAPFRWQVSDTCESLWRAGKIARYNNQDAWILGR